MAKKNNPTNLPSADVRTEMAFGEADTALAVSMGLNLNASPSVRTEQAVFTYNIATRSLVEAGVLLASVKAEMDQDAFIALINERGLGKERAYELIRGSSFVARLPDEQRDSVLALGKSKVLALASADPRVVETMLEDDDFDITHSSVREMRKKIRDMEADLADVAVQRDTAEAQVEALKKQAKPGKREDKIPFVVADLRAEIVALAKKGGLAVDSFNGLGMDLMGLIGTEEAHEWADATLRLAVASLCNLRLQLDGVVKKFLDQLEGEDPMPAERSYLSKGEVLEAAKAYQGLIAEHSYEKALREWEAEQARPKGRGAPKKKPVDPSTH